MHAWQWPKTKLTVWMGPNLKVNNWSALAVNSPSELSLLRWQRVLLGYAICHAQHACFHCMVLQEVRVELEVQQGWGNQPIRGQCWTPPSLEGRKGFHTASAKGILMGNSPMMSNKTAMGRPMWICSLPDTWHKGIFYLWKLLEGSLTKGKGSQSIIPSSEFIMKMTLGVKQAFWCPTDLLQCLSLPLSFLSICTTRWSLLAPKYPAPLEEHSVFSSCHL